jgi:hypothetical protein
VKLAFLPKIFLFNFSATSEKHPVKVLSSQRPMWAFPDLAARHSYPSRVKCSFLRAYKKEADNASLVLVVGESLLIDAIWLE